MEESDSSTNLPTDNKDNEAQANLGKCDNVKSENISNNECSEQNTRESNVQNNSNIEEVFRDPSTFDFLQKIGNSKPFRDLRKESLYLKFDPCVGSYEDLSEDSNIQKQEALDSAIYNEKEVCSTLLPMSSNASGILVDIEEEHNEESPIFPKTECPQDTFPAESSDASSSATCKSSEENIKSMRVQIVCLRERLVRQELMHREKINRFKIILQPKQGSQSNQDGDDEKDKAALYWFVIKEYEDFINILKLEKQKLIDELENIKRKLQEDIRKIKEHSAIAEKAHEDLIRKFKDVDFNIKSLSNDKVSLHLQENSLIEMMREQKQNIEKVKHDSAVKLSSIRNEIMEAKNIDSITSSKTLLKTLIGRECSLKIKMGTLTEENNKLLLLIQEETRK